jgi:hypothetical protein
MIAYIYILLKKRGVFTSHPRTLSANPLPERLRGLRGKKNFTSHLPRTPADIAAGNAGLAQQHRHLTFSRSGRRQLFGFLPARH